LEKKGVNRTLSAIIIIVIIGALSSLIITLLSAQIIAFTNDLPLFEASLTKKLEVLQEWVKVQFGLTEAEQITFIKSKSNEVVQQVSQFLLSTLTGFAGALVDIVIIPIYIFFFITYRKKFKKFLLMLSGHKNYPKMEALISETQVVIQNYLKGVFIVIGVLAVLNTSALFIIGIKYAFFLGALAAILNIIPYIGVLIGSGFAILMAFLTKDSFTPALITMATFWVIQLIENNLLTPRITGQKVNINSFATIVFLLVGAAIWGIAGMVLFIPLLGVLKIIMEKISFLKPVAYLIDTKDT
jgi:predicted PurR-regulated permease PerM